MRRVFFCAFNYLSLPTAETLRDAKDLTFLCVLQFTSVASQICVVLFRTTNLKRDLGKAKRATMRLWILICIFSLSAFAADAHAGRPGWFIPLRNQAQVQRVHVFQGHGHRVAPSYQETYHYLNARYPKYIGAFHANYFRDLGVAPGDVGIRGNSLYPFPW